jgi:hypothetical protein
VWVGHQLWLYPEEVAMRFFRSMTESRVQVPGINAGSTGDPGSTTPISNGSPSGPFGSGINAGSLGT